MYDTPEGEPTPNALQDCGSREAYLQLTQPSALIESSQHQPRRVQTKKRQLPSSGRQKDASGAWLVELVTPQSTRA